MHSVTSRLVVSTAIIWAAVFCAGVAGGARQGNSTAAKMKNPVPATRASIAEGQKAFQKYCKQCHGDTGRGNGAMAPKESRPADFTDDRWDHGSTDGEIFFVISEGGGKGSVMKGFKSKLTEKEIWHTVNYVKSLGAKR